MKNQITVSQETTAGSSIKVPPQWSDELFAFLHEHHFGAARSMAADGNKNEVVYEVIDIAATPKELKFLLERFIKRLQLNATESIQGPAEDPVSITWEWME